MSRFAWMVCLFELVCTTAFVSEEALADSPPTFVGSHGSVRELIIEGADQIPAEKIRRGLLTDTQFQLVCRPTTYWNTWKKTLQAHLVLGYEWAGFPEAEVEVSWNDEKNCGVIRVVEGQRYLNGVIRLEAPDGFDTPAVTRTLNQPSPTFAPVTGAQKRDSTEVMWKAGKYCKFDRFSSENRHLRIEQALHEHGCFFSKFTTRIERNESAHTADLVVTVTDPGPPSIIRQIDVSGLLRHDEATVIEAAGLKLGEELQLTDLRDAERLLMDTGRFWDARCHARRIDDDDSGIRLELNAVEYSAAPKLNDPLTERQQAMMRLCGWLNGLSRSNDQLEMKIDMQGEQDLASFHAVIAPQHGWIVSATGRYSGFNFNYAIVAQKGFAAIYSLTNRARLIADDIDLVPGVQLIMQPAISDRDKEWCTSLTMGVGGGTSGNAWDGLDCRAIPVTFIRETIKHGDHWELKDNILRYENEGLVVIVDARTGRPQSARLDSDDLTIDLTVHSDAFQTKVAELDSACPEQGHYASGTAFFAAEIASTVSRSETPQSLTPEARKIVEHLIQPVDQMFVRMWGSEDTQKQTRFWVPVVKKDSKSSFARLVMVPTFNVTDAFFPAGSWPWILSRELAGGMLGISGGTSEFQRLASKTDYLGPVGYSAVGSAIGLLNESVGRAFSMSGAHTLNADDYRNDLEILFDAETPFATAFEECVQRFRELDNAQIETLQTGCPDSWKPFWISLDEGVRQYSGTNHRNAFLNTAKQSWAPLILPIVEPILRPQFASEGQPARN